MPNLFGPLDGWLFERVFQPACDLIVDRFGIDRVSAACWCVDLASLGWIIARAPGLATLTLNTAFNVLTLLLGLVALTALRTVFRRARSGAPSNPLRLSMQPHRAILLLLLVSRLIRLNGVAVSDAADIAMMLFAAMALYFGACASRPPGRRFVSYPASSNTRPSA